MGRKWLYSTPRKILLGKGLTKKNRLFKKKKMKKKIYITKSVIIIKCHNILGVGKKMANGKVDKFFW